MAVASEDRLLAVEHMGFSCSDSILVGSSLLNFVQGL